MFKKFKGELFIKSKFLKYGFYFSSLILLVYGLIRFINMIKIMWIFPLDTTNDISSYMAMLHFFVQYGFHGFVPNWYNGFVLFSVYPPGWMFVVYPLYLIFKNVQIVAYVALIIQYLFGFLVVAVFGRNNDWSWLKVITFFSFLFLNVFAVGDFIRQLRLPAFFGFELLIALSLLLFYYKDRKVDFWFGIIFVPLFFALILVHQTEAILFSIFLIGFFLIKSFKEKLFIFLNVVLGFIFSAFWWVPFLKYSSQLSIQSATFGNWLLDFDRLFLTNLATILISITFFILFFYWYLENRSYKNLLFFIPLLILNFLFLTRLVIFIPILKYVYPEPFTHLFIFLILYLFFTLNFEKIKPFLLNFIIILVFFILPLLFVILSHFNTPYYIEYTSEENEVLSLFKFISVDDKYYVVGVEDDNIVQKRLIGDVTSSSYGLAYYSYGPIYFNFSSPVGWADIYASEEYMAEIQKTASFYNKKDCLSFKRGLFDLNTTKLITYGFDDFNFLSSCFNLIEKQGNAYLFDV